jgi:hypothetical protein
MVVSCLQHLAGIGPFERLGGLVIGLDAVKPGNAGGATGKDHPGLWAGQPR